MIGHLKRAKNSDTDFIVFLADGLAKLGAREAIPALRQKAGSRAAGSAGGRACVQALVALARPDDEDAKETVQVLIKALDSRHTDIRSEALTGLGRLKATEAVENIKHLLTKDREPLVRNAATKALKEIEGK
jgi:HEAT repeat protein